MGHRAPRSYGLPNGPIINASPPLALARPSGATGPVEGIELGHVLGRDGEVEHAEVLLDPLAVGRLRDHDHAALQAPPNQNLRGCTADAGRDPFHRLVSQMLPRPEWAIRLERDPAFLARFEQRPSVLEG